jgi:hypothetical protein
MEGQSIVLCIELLFSLADEELGAGHEDNGIINLEIIGQERWWEEFIDRLSSLRVNIKVDNVSISHVLVLLWHSLVAIHLEGRNDILGPKYFTWLVVLELLSTQHVDFTNAFAPFMDHEG